MENEHKLLEYIHKDEYTSQRKIAEGTGLSVGTVNILLKRMVKKGMVKIERLNARSLRYILTPQGLLEKSKLTYRYIKHSYEYILKVTDAIEEIHGYVEDHGMGQLFLYGDSDEVLQILKIALERRQANFSYIKNKDDLPDEGIVIVWDIKHEDELESQKVFNLLKVL